MMEKPMNMETEAQPMPEEPQGIDGIIARVDQYIAKPEMITPDTLMELRAELEDLKGVLEPEEPEATPPASGPASGGLAGMLGGGR